jgi:hypothetical protein
VPDKYDVIMHGQLRFLEFRIMRYGIPVVRMISMPNTWFRVACM